MEALVHQRKSLIIILAKQTQHFAWISIIVLIIVICLLMEKKSLSLEPTIKKLTFKLNSVLEVYLMDIVIPSLEIYLYMKMRMIFQSITILFINLAC